MSEKKVKNVLFLALGGHGTYLARLLNEKIAEKKEKSQVDLKINSKILAIDNTRGTGDFVGAENFVYIPGPYHSIYEAWADFQKIRKLKKSSEEPWMDIGPRPKDPVISGVRYADGKLFMHLARDRIYLKIRETLVNSFPKSNDSQPIISVVILGSLAGMTSSTSYTPVLKILETLNREFNIAPSYSFLFTPQAMRNAYGDMGTVPSLCFLSSAAEIHDYFRNYKGAFKPTQFLIDKVEDCLINLNFIRSQGGSEEFYCDCELIKNIISFTDSQLYPSVINEEVKSLAFGVGNSDLKRVESMVEHIHSLSAFHRGLQSDGFLLSGDWKSVPFKELFSNLV